MLEMICARSWKRRGRSFYLVMSQKYKVKLMNSARGAICGKRATLLALWHVPSRSIAYLPPRHMAPTLHHVASVFSALARRGARRKAVQALTSDVIVFVNEDQRRWANELLPSAGLSCPERPPPLEPTELFADALDGDQESPLNGMRFGFLCGPTPSGARLEHLRDMLRCGRRGLSNRLLQALRTTQELVAAGRLLRAWDWVLRTRLVYLKKKRGAKPRPVRIGELWRRVVSKWLLHKAAPAVRQVMLMNQQYAVCLPDLVAQSFLSMLEGASEQRSSRMRRMVSGAKSTLTWSMPSLLSSGLLSTQR